jgi:hypothetical protein
MRFVFLVPAALFLTGCGSDDFTCSSSTVLETVGNIARKQLGENPQMMIFDVKNAGVKVDNIRQQGRNDRALNCAGTIGLTGLRPLPFAKMNPYTGQPWTKGGLGLAANRK